MDRADVQIRLQAPKRGLHLPDAIIDLPELVFRGVAVAGADKIHAIGFVLGTFFLRFFLPVHGDGFSLTAVLNA